MLISRYTDLTMSSSCAIVISLKPDTLIHAHTIEPDRENPQNFHDVT